MLKDTEIKNKGMAKLESLYMGMQIDADEYRMKVWHNTEIIRNLAARHDIPNADTGNIGYITMALLLSNNIDITDRSRVLKAFGNVNYANGVMDAKNSDCMDLTDAMCSMIED